MKRDDELQPVVRDIFVFVIVLIVIAALLIFGYQWFKVLSQTMTGKAALYEAEFSKKIAVEDAKAKLESAELLAQAEVQRAKGVAEANKIIGESLKNNESYLRYLWIQNLQEGDNEVIYIPTEAGLPILEAGKR